MSEEQEPHRPKHIEGTEIPPFPSIDRSKPDDTSVTLSEHRTSYHLACMRGLRGSMHDAGLIHAQTGFPVSLTLMTALLLVLGLVAIVSVVSQVGPLR
jgi:hypothetical protein